ncbi:hypothetical protein [Acinetobacter silvestris]|uniref:Uncharacterized protein n=1 Tax=Acinetobacter silvestris TaxID=1977882 RepID=A0A1Y3CI10_9GAMM|nr:hypothetical protein [Acinetobacter silvestris]OTG64793.1 hypothetical protein B9T28_11345 [Acinetobacter silvestris]
MSLQIKRLYSIGTKGKAKDKIFEAKRNSLEKFVLNVKQAADLENPTDKAVKKVFVDSLDEAYALLSQDGYFLNLTSSDGQRALCELNKVKVEYTLI